MLLDVIIWGDNIRANYWVKMFDVENEHLIGFVPLLIQGK